jgi:hypothetical protein
VITDINKATPQEKFDHLFEVISGKRFLEKQGLGNEVPFFICHFPPKEAVEMDRHRKGLVNRLGQAGVRVLEINLYDLTIELLEKEGDFQWYLKHEAEMNKHKFLEELQGILDVENVLIPAIADILSQSEYGVLFLSGVGEVFPYIRSHNVLNNLQSTAKDKPTVLFFPGIYSHSLESGASLDLFGRFRDDKYYRAFNIFHCEA